MQTVRAEHHEHHDVQSISSYYISKAVSLPRTALAAVASMYTKTDVDANTLECSNHVL